MNKILLVLLLLVLQNKALAINKETDSLWSVWKNPAQQDTTRLKALRTFYSKKYMRSNADSAVYFAKQGLEFARKRKLDRDIGLEMNSIAQCFMNLGRLDSALIYFEEGIHYSGKVGDFKNLAGMHINRGIVFNHLGQAEVALEQYDLGIAYCDKIGEFNFKMNALNNKGVIYLDTGHYDKAIDVFQSVIEIAGKTNYGSEAHMGGLVNIGFALSKKGDHVRAIDYYDKCLKLIEEFDGGQVEHFVHNFLGISYRELGENDDAVKHFERAYELGKEFGDPAQMATPLANMADILALQGDRKSAYRKHEEAYSLMKAAKHSGGTLSAISSLAKMNLEDNKLDSALVKYNMAMALALENGEIDKKAEILAGLGLISLKKGNAREGINLLNEALKIGNEIGSLSIVRDASKELANAYKITGDIKKALEMHEQFVLYKDSLESKENQRAVIRQAFRYSYDKQALADSLAFAQKEAIKDLEIEKRDANLAKQQIGLLATGGGILMLGFLLWSIRKGKKRSDELLHNILPEEVASELKQKGEVGSKKIDSVTVLFTDFKGFTQISEQVTPKELVKDLHEYFSAFDRICEKHNIEKIKTIGDAYMAAGGLPIPNTTHAKDAVKAALEMAEVVEKGKAKKMAAGLPYFEIRIGIHTGPVVAGIVGVKKFQYDIWGDTVNTASRMESSGAEGKVNISQSTYNLLKTDTDFTFVNRGKIEAKGKGEIEMWFVNIKGRSNNE